METSDGSERIAGTIPFSRSVGLSEACAAFVLPFRSRFVAGMSSYLCSSWMRELRFKGGAVRTAEGRRSVTLGRVELRGHPCLRLSPG